MARANIRPAIFFGRSRPISTTHRPVRSPWQQCSPRGDGRSGCLGPGRVHLTTLNAGTARLSAWGTVTAATQASRRSPPPAAANHIPQPGAAAGRRHACIMIRRPHRRWHRRTAAGGAAWRTQKSILVASVPGVPRSGHGSCCINLCAHATPLSAPRVVGGLGTQRVIPVQASSPHHCAPLF